jgi:hypothetical protein
MKPKLHLQVHVLPNLISEIWFGVSYDGQCKLNLMTQYCYYNNRYVVLNDRIKKRFGE